MQAITAHRAADRPDAGVVALKLDNGSHADLSKPVFETIPAGGVITAVKLVAENSWSAEATTVAARSQEDLLMTPQWEAGSTEVVVTIGDSHTCAINVAPGMTFGWLISEAIRRFMAEHDEEDPGILGLRTSDGVDLDLADEVAAVVPSGAVVHDVSYTISAKTARKRSFTNQQKKMSSGAAAAAHGPLDESNLNLASAGLSAQRVRDVLKTISSPFRDTQVDSQESAVQPHRFLTLRELIVNIQDAEKEEQTESTLRRFSEAEAPQRAYHFRCECIADPSGSIGRYVELQLDAARLIIRDVGSGDIVLTWRYEVIQSWLVETKAITLKVVKEAGGAVQQYVFSTPQSNLLSDTLLSHANLIATTRRHQKQQKMVQQMRDKAEAVLKTTTEEPTASAELASGTSSSFMVQRFIDPSGMLSKHLILSFSKRELQVLDATTRDVLFDWPYLMVRSPDKFAPRSVYMDSSDKATIVSHRLRAAL